eukprot:5122242-Prymnesium_polylepis.2
MFYVPTNCDGDIHDGPRCEDYVRAAHRKFLQNFTLSEIQVPLLKFDLWNWDAPFSAMPNPSSSIARRPLESYGEPVPVVSKTGPVWHARRSQRRSRGSRVQCSHVGVFHPFCIHAMVCELQLPMLQHKTAWVGGGGKGVLVPSRPPVRSVFSTSELRFNTIKHPTDEIGGCCYVMEIRVDFA